MSEAHAVEQNVELVNIDVEVGIVVQSLMFRHREQQRDLAAAIGTSPASLSRKLRGMTSFSPADLMRIARHYGVEAGDLLPRLDSNQQPCGYMSSLVSADAEALWDTWFDWFVADDEWGVGCGAADRWFDWWRWQAAHGLAPFALFRELGELRVGR